MSCRRDRRRQRPAGKRPRKSNSRGAWARVWISRNSWGPVSRQPWRMRPLRLPRRQNRTPRHRQPGERSPCPPECAMSGCAVSEPAGASGCPVGIGRGRRVRGDLHGPIGHCRSGQDAARPPPPGSPCACRIPPSAGTGSVPCRPLQPRCPLSRDGPRAGPGSTGSSSAPETRIRSAGPSYSRKFWMPPSPSARSGATHARGRPHAGRLYPCAASPWPHQGAGAGRLPYISPRAMRRSTVCRMPAFR